MRALVDAACRTDVRIAIGTSGTVFPAAGLIDLCRPDTVRVLVHVQSWADSASAFERGVRVAVR